MATSFQGGCHCGAIRFEAEGDPVMVVHCHCTDCQKITGAHMATVAGVPEASFRVVKGEPKVYATTGDSGGKVNRSFCSHCGSTLFSRVDAMPDVVFVEAGGLDDASGLEPSMHIYTRSAQPWARIPEDMQAFPTMPGP